MILDFILDIGKSIVAPITTLIDNLSTSDEEKLTLKNQLQQMNLQYQAKLLEYDAQLIKAKSAIIVAETQGNWLTKSWRPILMLVIVAIIANNFLIYPYLSMFIDEAVILELPTALYTLMTVGVGGYITGRSGEKIIEKWKK